MFQFVNMQIQLIVILQFIKMNQKDFNAQVINLFKGKQINPQIFWQSLQQSQFQGNAACYSAQLFENIMNPTNINLVNVNQQRLFNTLLVIQYYKNRKEKSQSVVGSYNKYKQKKKIIGHPKWILDLFINPLKDEMFAQNFMSQLIFAPKNIDWNLNIQVLMDSQVKQAKIYVQHRQISMSDQQYYDKMKLISIPKVVGVDIKTMSFSYICFLDYLRGNSNQIKPSEYNHMAQLLRALMHYVKKGDSSIEYLCVFIHFIINCITFHSCTQERIIKQLIIVVDHLRSFCGPAGQMASQLFDLLYKQLKVPGNAFRKKLRYDFPSLDMKQSNFLNKQLYIITQSQDYFSWPSDRSLLNLRKQIIWHVMKICEIQRQKSIQYLKLIRGLPNDPTYQLYFKTLKIVDISSQMQVFDKTKDLIKNHMERLLSQTVERHKKDNKFAEQLQRQQFDQLTLEENTFNIFRYPQYELIHVKINEFLSKKSKISFNSIIKKSRSEHSHLIFYQDHISFVFYGTSLQFVDLVQVLSMFLEDADIQQSMKLHIYYLPKPSARNYSIASYIAAKDIWYRNFVYYLFQQNMIFPQLQLNLKNKNLFPSYLINKTLHMYIREAKRIFHLRVYKCLLKTQQTQQLKQIFFTQHITLGLFTEAEVIRESKLKGKQRKQKYQKLGGLEIVKQKLQRYKGYIVDISFEYILPLTNQVLNKSEKGYGFEDIQICNIPKQNFFGSKPDPSGNSLKLSILNNKDGKIFRKQIFNKDNFGQNKITQQTYSAFQELFLSYSIKSMKLRAKNQQLLKIMIDGRIYHNVQSFQILSPLTANGLPITLPILTFLPFK